MTAHVTVDSRSKLLHTVQVQTAHGADRDASPYLLHGLETRVWGDQCYQGQAETIRHCAPTAQGRTNRRYRIGRRIEEVIKAQNCKKSRVRAGVEPSIAMIKGIFGFKNVHHRGLATKTHWREVTAALVKLFLVRGQPLRRQR